MVGSGDRLSIWRHSRTLDPRKRPSREACGSWHCRGLLDGKGESSAVEGFVVV